MKRGKILLLAGMVVTAILVVLTGFYMFQALSSAARSRRGRDASRAHLEGFYRRNPFPTPENVERERENLGTVQAWYERLLAGLKASSVPMTETMPSVFNSRRETIIAELISSAPPRDGGTRAVAPDFGFGFDRYKTGVLANPRDVPRLMRQLQMVEALVQEMYQAGILRIVSLSREEFEAELPSESAAPMADPVGFRRGRARVAEETAPDPGPGRSGRIRAPVPMDRQRFSFELVAKEEPLVSLLNRVAAMDMFAVVTKLSVSKEGADYTLAPERDRETPAALLGGVPAPAQAVANPRPPSRSARLVSGRDREAKIKVSLEIEVYSFEGGG